MHDVNLLIDELSRPLLAGSFLPHAARERLLSVLPEAGPEDLAAFGRLADAVRQARVGNHVSLCAIISAKSGRCGQDCAFCAQSGHYATSAPEHPFLDPQAIVAAARAVRASGVARFGVVASGLALPPDEIGLAKAALAGIAALGLAADASLGLLPAGALAELKTAGLAAYHHNLETSPAYYPTICTTRTFEQNAAVLREATALGIPCCSGGLFGLGESWRDRLDLALVLLDLGVASIPVNFLIPMPGTPLAGRPRLSPDEAKKIVILLRLLLPDRHIRICGGRPGVFGPDQGLAPMAVGASGLMVGDYLTAPGASLTADMSGLAAMGLLPRD